VKIETVGGALPVQMRDDGEGREVARPEFRKSDGPTTGVIWSAEGEILTSTFNVLRDPSVITVTLHDGRRYVAKLVARDYAMRVALLKIDAEGLSAVRLPALGGGVWPGETGGKPVPQTGQWSVVAGFGHGGAEATLSTGIVSAVGRMLGCAIQTDAKISPANYGGPVVNLDGEMLGLCVPADGAQSESAVAGLQWYDSGIGFAISSDVLRERLERLRRGENLQRGWIGVSFVEESPQTQATTTATSGPSLPRDSSILRVVEVQEGGPAHAADVRAGDIITGIDGQPVSNRLQLMRVLVRKAAGDSVSLELVRDGAGLKVTIPLAQS
jgi:serine protease Do